MSSSSLPPRVEGTTYNLLFVCSGNTCRSPMAEGIARTLLSERGWSHVDVQSAGTGAAPGMAATPEAVDVGLEHGVRLEHHTSQPLTPELIAWADLILTMSPSHLQVVNDLGGETKVALITEFIDGAGYGLSVADPFGGDHDTYRDAFIQIEAAVSSLLDRLEPILSP
jgi:protein-tyrosine-phosphatase